MATTPMFAPDGTLGDVPTERVQDAIKAGGKVGVEMFAPDGTKGVVPAERFQDAVKAGGRPVTIGTPEPQRPGILSTMGSALGRIGKAIITPQAQNPYPGMGLEQKQEAAQESAAEDAERKKAGYSTGYRMAAPIAQSIGVNVPKMEQDAKEGNERAVIGEAAAPAVALGAARAIPAIAESETAGKLGRTGIEAGKGALKLGDVAVFERGSKAIKTVGNTAGKIGDIWRKPPVYPGAPLPEHPGIFPGAPLPENPGTFSKVPLGPEAPPADVLRAAPLSRGPQSAKIVNPADALKAIPTKPVFPGAPLPEHPGVFSKVPLGPEPAPAPIPKAVAAKKLEALLGNALDVKPPQIPEGHTPVESSALTSFKYDPEAKELHFAFKSNPDTVHVFGDISPEQAQAFLNAKSKGSAFQAIKNSSSPQVAKIINGERIAMKPVRMAPAENPKAIPTAKPAQESPVSAP